ncbi:MAG: hypothetical protein R6V37_02585 [Psychroflexus maritimus]
MNHPIVKKLEYQLLTDETLTFEAPPLSFSTDDFELTLQNESINIKLLREFTSVENARKFIEEFFDAWKVKTELEYGTNSFSFKFLDAEVIDRNPSKPTEQQIFSVGVSGNANASGKVKFIVTRKKYPEPPLNFELSPNVRTLWTRYKNYKSNHESIFSMAYFCYTVATQYGGKQSASERFYVSKSILNKISELSSTKGDQKSARKYSAINPTTKEEITWLESAVRALIKQIAICDSGNIPEKLTMNNLPKLSKN